MKRIAKHVAGLLDARLRTRRPVSQRQNAPAELPMEFDEAWYLRAYPDVARAVAAGVYASAHAHYLHRGVEEGRSTGAQRSRIAPGRRNCGAEEEAFRGRVLGAARSRHQSGESPTNDRLRTMPIAGLGQSS